MKKPNAIVLTLLAAAIAAAGLLSGPFNDDSSMSGRNGRPVASRAAVARVTVPTEQVARPSEVAAPAEPALDAAIDPDVIAFKADARGRIVTDEKARLDLEKLYALYDPVARMRKLQELEQTLPPAAAQQLRELMEQYKNYQEAQYQLFPPGQEMVSPEEGLGQIEGMHALRAQYFGEQTATAMFGEEEKVQRELYRLMAVETDQSLTLEEKAERAQELYSTSMPAVAAAERKAAAEEAQRLERAPHR